MGPQNTASIWAALCQDLQTQRQSAERAQHHSAAQSFVAAAKQVFGKRPLRLSEALEIAGDIHHSAGGPELARESYEEALSIAIEQKEIPSCIRILTKLGALYETLGDLPNAKKTYRQCIDITQESHDVSNLPALMNNLAGIEKRLGETENAEQHYKKAIEIATTIHGQSHPEVATLLNNYGVLQLEKSNDIDAENLHLQALAIREKAYGANHPEVARSLHNLAVVFQSRGDFRKARAYYEAAREIFKRFVDSDDAEMQTLLENYKTLPPI